MQEYKLEKEKYNVGSGSYSLADSSIKTSLDEYGNFKSLIHNFDSIKKTHNICCMRNSQDNESTIGDFLFGSQPYIHHDKKIGFYLALYAGYVSEGSYRENGSSGGVASWICVELLRKKMIDGVIHIKRSNKNGILFEYSVSRSETEIKSGSKSRYYPAEYSEIINSIKNDGKKYAIIGIPSLIMEIRLLQKHFPEIKKSIKYTIGLICGHQKSTKYAECIAWQFGIKPGDLLNIDFRKKDLSKPAGQYITEITGYLNGEITTLVKNQQDIFVSDWGHGFFKNTFSDYTDDAFNETSDISLGDAWLPEYTQDGKGNNIIIVRNHEIQTIIENGLIENRLLLDSITKEKIIRSQSGLVHHSQDEIGYRLYKRDRKKEWRPLKRTTSSDNIPFLRKKIQDTREDISILSHVIYKEAIKKNNFQHFKKRMTPHVIKYKILYLLLQASNNSPQWIIKKAFNKMKNIFN